MFSRDSTPTNFSMNTNEKLKKFFSLPHKSNEDLKRFDSLPQISQMNTNKK